MARFELGGESVEGWLENVDGAIVFRTRRGGDAVIERARGTGTSAGGRIVTRG